MKTRGLTLTELVLAMVITCLVLTGVAALGVSSFRFVSRGTERGKGLNDLGYLFQLIDQKTQTFLNEPLQDSAGTPTLADITYPSATRCQLSFNAGLAAKYRHTLTYEWGTCGTSPNTYGCSKVFQDGTDAANLIFQDNTGSIRPYARVKDYDPTPPVGINDADRTVIINCIEAAGGFTSTQCSGPPIISPVFEKVGTTSLFVSFALLEKDSGRPIRRSLSRAVSITQTGGG